MTFAEDAGREERLFNQAALVFGTTDLAPVVEEVELQPLSHDAPALAGLRIDRFVPADSLAAMNEESFAEYCRQNEELLANAEESVPGFGEFCFRMVGAISMFQAEAL